MSSIIHQEQRIHLINDEPRVITQEMSRRRFIKGVGAIVAGAGLPLLSDEGFAKPFSSKDERPHLLSNAGPAIPNWPQPNEVRQIWLRRQETGEAVVARYYDGRSLDWAQYEACCTILRDVQSGTVARIDVELLDLIFAIQKWLVDWGIDRPMVVHSGYRTHRTNSKEGGSARSMHLKGRAIDFHIEGVPAKYLGRLVQIFGIGGVGFYLNRGFVHADTGSVRQWSK